MCSNSSFSYFATWQFQATTSHLLTFLTCPFNLFCGYCILKKTPKQYKTAKWYLLHLHSWTIFTDLILGACVTPHMFFPAFAGISTGIFAFFAIPIPAQIFMAQIALGGLATSIVMIFENRHHTLVRGKFKFEKNWARFLFYTIHGVYSILFLLPVYFQIPEAYSAKMLLLRERLPCPHPDYYLDTVFVFTTNASTLIETAGIFIIFVVFEAIFMCFHSSFHLFRFDVKISEQTRKMQRKLFGDMILQVSVPIFVIVVPMAYCLVASWALYYNQVLNNIAVIFITSHGISSTITIFATNHTYRQHFCHVILRRKLKPSQMRRPSTITVNAVTQF